jgi:hypothetical protein
MNLSVYLKFKLKIKKKFISKAILYLFRGRFVRFRKHFFAIWNLKKEFKLNETKEFMKQAWQKTNSEYHAKLLFLHLRSREQ